MSTPIAPGSRVMYARSFLRSISAFTGAMPFARGVVKAVDREIATIDWDNDPEGEEIPPRVNVANLVLEDRLHLEER